MRIENTNSDDFGTAMIVVLETSFAIPTAYVFKILLE